MSVPKQKTRVEDVLAALPRHMKSHVLSFVPSYQLPQSHPLTILTERNYRQTHEVKFPWGYETQLADGKLHSSRGKPAVAVLSGPQAGVRLWYKDGVLHRKGKPAVVCPPGVVDDQGNLRPVEEWYVNGRLHREGGPAIRFSTGRLLWARNGKITSEQNPNGEKIDYHPNGRVARLQHPNGDIEYFNDRGQLHNTTAPAMIREDGVRWYRNGKLHRNKGPAVASTATGIPVYEWHRDGQRHRKGGPAVINAHPMLEGIDDQWWERGERVNGIVARTKLLLRGKRTKGISTSSESSSS